MKKISKGVYQLIVNETTWIISISNTGDYWDGWILNGDKKEYQFSEDKKRQVVSKIKNLNKGENKMEAKKNTVIKLSGKKMEINFNNKGQLMKKQILPATSIVNLKKSNSGYQMVLAKKEGSKLIVLAFDALAVTPWVTWRAEQSSENPSVNGFFSGNYFETFEDAIEDLKTR